VFSCYGELSQEIGIDDDDETPLFEQDELDAEYDPLEPFNRLMFSINDAVDKVFFVPLASAYKHILPYWTQCAIENMIGTVFAPVRFINFVLQGEGEQAVKTVFRFVFNLVFGFFGICDVAKTIGLTTKNTSFEDTLRKWGAGTGPYIVLPILGPSSFRGTIGSAFEMPFSPAAELSLKKYKKSTREKIRQIMWATDKLATRASLLDIMNDLEKTSIDKYAATRNAVMSIEKAK
jgi:phospholipid-binding lipoprotein MlaA